MSLSGRLVSCVSMPFVPPAFGNLGSIDSLKIQPDQPGHATCLTFASGTGEFEKVGHLAAFSAMTDAAGLYIVTSLAPSIFEDDRGERDTAHRAEPAHGVANRQQGIRVETGRKAQSRFRFLLE